VLAFTFIHEELAYMRPLGHFALAALPLTAYVVTRHHRLPSGHAILILLFATQLPDIIDKPLAWSFGIIPSGRMLAHSLVISGPVLLIIFGFGYYHERIGIATIFALGYLSHLVGDFYPILSLGTEYYFFPNLFWPLLAANPDMNPSFVAHTPQSITGMVVPLIGFGLVCGYVIYDLAKRQYAMQAAFR
jgi:hypothetical protein